MAFDDKDMQGKQGWSRNQLLIAFKLYCEIPFGRLHARNPDIIKYAKLIDRTPSALAMKLTNIASLDPVIRSSGRRGLVGASVADKTMWVEMQSDWTRFAQEIEVAEASYSSKFDDEIVPNLSLLLDRDYTGQERTIQAKARIGQNFFRRAVLSAYEFKCCITGLSIPYLLVASHIAPWRINSENRLNPRNGLCLSSLHDRAFDLGILTITRTMKVNVSKKYLEATNDEFFRTSVLNFDGAEITLPEKFPPDPQFLDYHRNHVFEQNSLRV